MTNDPIDASLGADEESPLWAFTKQRALNRLALRTKLSIISVAAATEPTPKGYTAYAHENCYDGSGGHAIDDDGVANVTMAACTQRCDADAKCDCVTYLTAAQAVDSRCWKRSQCVPAEFEKDAATEPYSVFVKKDGPKPPPKQDGGALAYLKHDALGPLGEAAVMVFNPGAAQNVTIDLSAFPSSLLGGHGVPHDLLDPKASPGPPLAKAWTVPMAAGEVKALGGFNLASFAPRRGKKAECAADDGYSRKAQGTTLQACFLECLNDSKCANVYVDYVDIVWMEKPPPVSCTLLGGLKDPSTGCKQGQGTLIKKLVSGRPQAATGAIP